MNITSAQYYTEIDGTDNVGIKTTVDSETLFVTLAQTPVSYTHLTLPTIYSV